jgi:hypothetical protein
MYFLCCSIYFCVVVCIVCFVSFFALFVCICVLNYCHRVATQLQLNVSYRDLNLSFKLCGIERDINRKQDLAAIRRVEREGKFIKPVAKMY